jgi:hypothetical protein
MGAPLRSSTDHVARLAPGMAGDPGVDRNKADDAGSSEMVIKRIPTGLL